MTTKCGAPLCRATSAGRLFTTQNVASSNDAASSRFGEVDHESGHPVGADDRSAGGVDERAAVAEQHDVGGEESGGGGDVAGRERGNELRGHLLLLGERGGPTVASGGVGLAELAARPARDLANGHVARVEHRRDVGKRLTEDIGQQHGQAFLG